MATVLLQINDQTEVGKQILSLVKNGSKKGAQIVSAKDDNNAEFRRKMQAIRQRLIARHNAIADDKIK